MPSLEMQHLQLQLPERLVIVRTASDKEAFVLHRELKKGLGHIFFCTCFQVGARFYELKVPLESFINAKKHSNVMNHVISHAMNNVVKDNGEREECKSGYFLLHLFLPDDREDLAPCEYNVVLSIFWKRGPRKVKN
jgi:hypothetical protein